MCWWLRYVWKGQRKKTSCRVGSLRQWVTGVIGAVCRQWAAPCPAGRRSLWSDSRPKDSLLGSDLPAIVELPLPTLDWKFWRTLKLKWELCVIPCSINLNPVPDFSIVIKEDKDLCTVSIWGPSLHHESSTYSEGGRKVFLFQKGVCGAVVFVKVLIIVQGKVKSLQSGT